MELHTLLIFCFITLTQTMSIGPAVVVVVELCHVEYKGVGLHEIIIMEKVRPFIANKIIYFDEPEFNDRKLFSVANPVDIPFINLKFSGFSLPKPENAEIPKLKESA